MERQVLEIIHREWERSRLRRRNFAMRKQKGRSPRVVSTSAADGGTQEFEGQGPVETAICRGVHDN